jgi:hypothetical protein
VEVVSSKALTRGMRSLTIRLSRALTDGRGKVFEQEIFDEALTAGEAFDREICDG